MDFDDIARHEVLHPGPEELYQLVPIGAEQRILFVLDQYAALDDVDVVDADLAFIAEAPADAVWEQAPMNFDDAADMAPAGASVAITAVYVEEVAEDETDDAYENGVQVIFTTKRPASATKDRRQCGATIQMCRRAAGTCAPADNVACFLATSRTTGEHAELCRSTFGDCEQLRSVAIISREYEVTDCFVMRYRKAK